MQGLGRGEVTAVIQKDIAGSGKGHSSPSMRNERASKKRIASPTEAETPASKKSLFLVPSPVSTQSEVLDIEGKISACAEWIKKRGKRVEKISTCALSVGFSPRNRATLIHWMSEFCFDHYIHRETFHLAVNLLDRFMSSSGIHSLQKGDLHLIGIVCISLSIKYSESIKASPRLLLKLSGITSDISVYRVVYLEQLLLESIEWRVPTVTCVAVVWRLLAILESVLKEEKEPVALRCFYLLDFLVLQPSFYDFPLLDVVINVLRTAVPTLPLQNSNLLCRVWVEEAWKQIENEWKEEGETIALQSFHSFFFSSLKL